MILTKNPQDKALSERIGQVAYSVQKEHLKTCAVLMANAFHDDPSIRYLLGGKTTGKNDWRYFLVLLKALYGSCYMLSSDETIRNLLILFPPALKSVPALRFFASGGIRLWRWFKAGLYTRSLAYESNCRRVKNEILTENAYYCMCFAVRRDMQGCGLGSQLIKPVLRILDDCRMPLYLETHKKINVRIYEKLGFALADTCLIPGTDTPQYAMLRFPKI